MDRTEKMVTDPKTGGMKASKAARFSLLPWDALWHVAEHYNAGAQKYPPGNWKKVTDPALFLDALARHLALYLSGERDDPETKTHHMAAVVFHALAVIWQDLCDPSKEAVKRPEPLAVRPDTYEDAVAHNQLVKGLRGLHYTPPRY